MAANKVLVIDDVEIVFYAFRNELEKEGFEVEFAMNGEAALEKVRLQKYDIVFIDMVMPGMDGIQTCRAIKEISPESRLVAMTGVIYKGLADKELDFIKAGGRVYYLYKPFQKGEILEVTKKALSEKEYKIFPGSH